MPKLVGNEQDGLSQFVVFNRRNVEFVDFNITIRFDHLSPNLFSRF